MPDSRHEREELLGTPPPPPVKRNRGRFVALLIGLVAAGTVLLIVFNIDPPQSPRDSMAQAPDEPRIVPEPLTEKDIEQATELGSRSEPLLVAERGWIQIADEHGRLEQQYRCEHLDPNPPGRPAGYVRMTKPQAEFHLTENRVLTLVGRTAIAHRPNNVLESGTVEDDVIIRLYELDGADVPARLTPDKLVMVLLTDEAQFDNGQGEIRCPNEVHVMTRMGDFRGRDLRMTISDTGDPIRSMQVHPIGDEPLRISHLALQRRNEEDGAAVQRPATASSNGAAAPSGSSTGSADSTQETATASEESRRSSLYRLTLSDDVVVRQGLEPTQLEIHGDTLALLFSMSRRPAQPQQAAAPARIGSRTAGIGRSVSDLMPWLVAGAIDQELSITPPRDPQQDIFVSCTGPIRMLPIESDDANRSAADETTLIVTGAPVRIFDRLNEFSAEGGALEHAVTTELTTLRAMPDQDVQLAAAQFDATGAMLTFERARNVATLAGPVQLTLKDIGADEGARGDSTSGATISSDGAAEFEFARANESQASGDSNALKRATFDRAVQVRSVQLDVDADHLTAMFDEAAGGSSPVLRMIDAKGSVFTAGKGSELRCDSLLAAFNQIGEETVIERLTAIGDVFALEVASAGGSRANWSDWIEVAFDPEMQVHQSAAAENQSLFAGSNVLRLDTRGDVQMRLADGGRVFADEIHGRREDNRMVVTGSPVLVVDRELVYERHGTIEIVEEANGKYRIEGPGVARIYGKPVLAAAELQDSRIARPVIADEPQLVTEWAQFMTYEDAADGRGAMLSFHGNVKSLATPSPVQRGSIESEIMQLELEGSDSDSQLAGAGGRRVRRLIAIGDARLENRTWLDETRAGKPRVHYVAGPRIEYNVLTGEAREFGRGTLLIRDELAEAGADPAAGAMPFSAKGTTQFSWPEKLEIVRAVDVQADAEEVAGQVYEVIFGGPVEIKHLSIDGEPAIMTARKLRALLIRIESGEGVQQGGVGDRLDLGGEYRLIKLMATEHVTVRTANRQVECGSFTYDYTTSIARLDAAPGGVVTILLLSDEEPPSAQPMTTEHAEWNLRTGEIRTISAAGQGAR